MPNKIIDTARAIELDSKSQQYAGAVTCDAVGAVISILLA